MKNLFTTTVITGAMAAVALGFAGASTAAVPSGPSNVATTISALEAQGYNVILNKVGATSLSGCTVEAIRPGQEVTRTDSGFPGDSLTTAVVSKSVYVDLTC